MSALFLNPFTVHIALAIPRHSLAHFWPEDGVNQGRCFCGEWKQTSDDPSALVRAWGDHAMGRKTMTAEEFCDFLYEYEKGARHES